VRFFYAGCQPCWQRFAYGLWRFQSAFLSAETEAGYEAKTLLAAVHPP